jgi:hypothetical protein
VAIGQVQEYSADPDSELHQNDSAPQRYLSIKGTLVHPITIIFQSLGAGAASKFINF